MKAKEMILTDAIRSCIEAEKKIIKLKRLAFILGVCCALMAILLVAGCLV